MGWHIAKINYSPGILPSNLVDKSASVAWFAKDIFVENDTIYTAKISTIIC